MRSQSFAHRHLVVARRHRRLDVCPDARPEQRDHRCSRHHRGPLHRRRRRHDGRAGREHHGPGRGRRGHPARRLARTRETDLMRPDNMVETMNAIVLSGRQRVRHRRGQRRHALPRGSRRRLSRRRRQRRADRADGRLVRSRDLQRAARLAAGLHVGAPGVPRRERRPGRARAMSAPAPAPCPAASRAASARRASCCRTASSSARSSR